jgi:hypothetical protein
VRIQRSWGNGRPYRYLVLRDGSLNPPRRQIDVRLARLEPERARELRFFRYWWPEKDPKIGRAWWFEFNFPGRWNLLFHCM